MAKSLNLNFLLSIRSRALKSGLKPSMVIMVVFLLLQSGQALAKDKVLASGKGFEVTQEFVQGVRSFYEQRGFSTTRQEILKAALRLKLFALESKEKGLIPEIPKGASDQSISELVRIYEGYIWQEMLDYPLESKVVESYYHSYPYKFLREQDSQGHQSAAGQLQGAVDEEDLRPLDQELQDKIRMHIVKAKRRQIVTSRFEQLQEKYQVQYNKQQ